MGSSIVCNDGRSHVDLSLCIGFKAVNDRETFLGVTFLDQIRSLLRNSVHGSLQMRGRYQGDD